MDTSVRNIILIPLIAGATLLSANNATSQTPVKQGTTEHLADTLKTTNYPLDSLSIEQLQSMHTYVGGKYHSLPGIDDEDVYKTEYNIDRMEKNNDPSINKILKDVKDYIKKKHNPPMKVSCSVNTDASTTTYTFDNHNKPLSIRYQGDIVITIDFLFQTDKSPNQSRFQRRIKDFTLEDIQKIEGIPNEAKNALVLQISETLVDQILIKKSEERKAKSKK